MREYLTAFPKMLCCIYASLIVYAFIEGKSFLLTQTGSPCTVCAVSNCCFIWETSSCFILQLNIGLFSFIQLELDETGRYPDNCIHRVGIAQLRVDWQRPDRSGTSPPKCPSCQLNQITNHFLCYWLYSFSQSGSSSGPLLSSHWMLSCSNCFWVDEVDPYFANGQVQISTFR